MNDPLESHSTKSALVTIGTAGVADLLSALKVDFSGLTATIASEAIKSYFDRKLDEQRRILLAELKNDELASWQAANKDVLFGAIFRFQRASLEGAGRHNLKLIAKALYNSLVSNELTADRFNLFADALASLSRSECALLGIIYPIALAVRKRHGIIQHGDGSREYWDLLKSSTIPKIYNDERSLTTALMALQRTGLVVPITAIDLALIAYEPSPLMEKLVELIGEEALSESCTDVP